MRGRTAIAIALVAGVGLAIGVSPAGAQDDGPICTEVGCSSGAFVLTGQIAKKLPEARRIQLCLDDRCRSFPASTDLAVVTDRKLDREQRVEVRMRVRGGGRVLAEDRIRPRLSKSQPNGPECPPTCFGVSLEVGRDLELHRNPDDRAPAACAASAAA